jgi:hypothetical protein
MTSLSSNGIQYWILVVLNAHGPLFIGWGLKWASNKIYVGAVRTVAMGRPDGQLYDKIFWKFCEEIFPIWEPRLNGMAHRPDGRTSAASNFLIRLRASRPWGMSVRTAILQHAISISAMSASGPWGAVVRTVEVESVISFFDERASRPQLSDIRTVIFELRFLP